MAEVKQIEADGIKFFYREQGDKSAPVVLLLHGFPSSSFQYRNLIPALASEYRVIAPDLPGFGFTKVPDERKYVYSFDNLAKSIGAFVDALAIKRFSVYVFDYGAPTGYRLALARPEAITSIISQNGNAYEEGFGAFWADSGLRAYWQDGKAEQREAIRALLTFETTRFQYEAGEAHPEAVDPATYTLDKALLDRPGNADIQLDLFYDYRMNVTMYPDFHAYFRKHQPPLLAIWGKNDPVFIPPGAESFKRDLPNAKITFIEGGHFLLETHLDEAVEPIRAFLKVHTRA
ncbi:hypothetical protein E5Q_02595 [Mixia osmundae IAM 14324]|uniref:AB hydrolase-1 domain-containing protein n=2 Tax=Mixia osmundae (strain CBS 9802 / IAM 14324 / JCM 22182 / KY 12970) TaxID=764103 RepID=G7DZC7_MIXOS|nr:hypothetical protein E5Q_02595 [Mixia osmundae IAM 14324]